MKANSRLASVIMMFCLGCTWALAQPVTGVWRGKLIRGSGLRQSSASLEVKLIKQGDSLRGTVYYYQSPAHFIRYSLKGWFDAVHNTVHWQDYYLIDKKPERSTTGRSYSQAMRTAADFSCPDGKTLRLDGESRIGNEEIFALQLRKVDRTLFGDEWDAVIEGYFSGMSHPDIIDSVWAIASVPVPRRDAQPVLSTGTAPAPAAAQPPDALALQPPPRAVRPVPPATNFTGAPNELGTQTNLMEKPVVPIIETTVGSTPLPSPPPATSSTTRPASPARLPDGEGINPYSPQRHSPPSTVATATTSTQSNDKSLSETTPIPATNPIPPPANPPAMLNTPATPSAMEKAYTVRKKIIQTEIPATGDSIELRFYDNAEVDGDSISLFLNGRMLFQHVRLDVRPYIFKIAVSDLPVISELTMVAENLGAIPPNTAFMEAFANGQRYTARLESTEVTSAVIRLVKKE